MSASVKRMKRDETTMDRIDFSLKLGVGILSEIHEYYRETSQDDAEHIRQLALIIKGISDVLRIEGISNDDIEHISAKLKQYGKDLYINNCLESAGDNDIESNIRDENQELFDYIYENHEYPY